MHYYSYPDEIQDDNPLYKPVRAFSEPQSKVGKLIAEIYAVIDNQDDQTTYTIAVKSFSEEECAHILYEWRLQDLYGKDCEALKRLIDHTIYVNSLNTRRNTFENKPLES